MTALLGTAAYLAPLSWPNIAARSSGLRLDHPMCICACISSVHSSESGGTRAAQRECWSARNVGDNKRKNTHDPSNSLPDSANALARVKTVKFIRLVLFDEFAVCHVSATRDRIRAA